MSYNFHMTTQGNCCRMDVFEQMFARAFVHFPGMVFKSWQSAKIFHTKVHHFKCGYMWLHVCSFCIETKKE